MKLKRLLMDSKMIKKKGEMSETLIKIALWIVFAIILFVAIRYTLERLGVW